MMPLRVLFVVENLARRSGMVLHVRDLAMARSMLAAVARDCAFIR